MVRLRSARLALACRDSCYILSSAHGRTWCCTPEKDIWLLLSIIASAVAATFKPIPFGRLKSENRRISGCPEICLSDLAQCLTMSTKCLESGHTPAARFNEEVKDELPNFGCVRRVPTYIPA